MNSADVIAQIKAKYPGFSIINKQDSLLMKIINILLIIITFGQMNTFMQNFVTTLGYTVYVPNTWESWDDSQRAIILSHEAVHMGQRVKYGMILFALMYTIILPSIFTYRSKFEMEAYTVSIQLTYQVTQDMDYMENDFKDFIVTQFVSANYFWMNPFKSQVEDWYDSVIATLK